MRVVMSGGGTAGHIYPALATAERLSADGHEVLFAGTPHGPEARLAREAGLVFQPVSAGSFDRSRPVTLLTSGAKMVLSAVRLWLTLGVLRPDVVACFGGYVSLPVGIAALGRRIPLVLHEQNAVPGIANRLLARWACAVGVTYPESIRRMSPGARCEHTGNPVRESVVNADPEQSRARFGLPAEATVLLVFGGSRGARRINRAVFRAAERLLADERVWIVHVTGRAEADDAHGAPLGSDDAKQRYRVFDYIDDMGAAIAASDLIIARAGATSIAEITAIGRASILVPYPYATSDHQTHNACGVASGGGALLVRDGELDGDRFEAALTELLDDAEARDKMARASRAMGVRDASSRLEALIVRCGEAGRNGGSA